MEVAAGDLPVRGVQWSKQGQGKTRNPCRLTQPGGDNGLRLSGSSLARRSALAEKRAEPLARLLHGEADVRGMGQSCSAACRSGTGDRHDVRLRTARYHATLTTSTAADRGQGNREHHQPK